MKDLRDVDNEFIEQIQIEKIVHALKICRAEVVSRRPENANNV